MHLLSKHLVRVVYDFTFVGFELSDDYGLTWRKDKVFRVFDINDDMALDFNFITALQIYVLTGRDLVL